ncbi:MULTISPECIES: hypothetical protein [Bacillus amyloliquefaciens group]|uniref:hypothetical protein n=1 Tax=Bacillus amyloliquefaciens group TaxID=1938374 RepID=UPI0002059474|nr:MULTISPECIES: hypothetical protein [Bacillus amyloliquefaciens group]AIW35049.1 hypothetical protein KS08_15930 [Bacillus subtilis]AEB25388.1 hypothetical protein BAMTA208_16180 [Bacillus amyloliquefaciens TA208]AEK90418.1 hypothetical protein BAXH7_03304 [Bacillus amyloliquefaciens XH7]MEC1831337.1 hypothetical protein [Bacillus amyloliquefaciens]MEC1834999.1 hypothetical protein [Bacillus amyloliquefaciens]
MTKYRRKAAEIEALKWGGVTQDSIDNLRKFIGDEAYKERCFVYPASNRLKIITPSSEVIAQVGDYIIRGIEDELYPCKPDIFEKTYEKVSDN